MNSDEAQDYLGAALSGLAKADPSLGDDSTIAEWYLIAVHHTASGPVFSRYTPPDQSDWTDLGLLRLATKLDERELGEASDED